MTRRIATLVVAAMMVTLCIFVTVAEPSPAPAAKPSTSEPPPSALQPARDTPSTSRERPPRRHLVDPTAHALDDTSLHGTFTALAPDGSTHVSENGWFRYWLFDVGGTGTDSGQAEVRDGHWSIPTSQRPTSIAIEDLQLGDRPSLWDACAERNSPYAIDIPTTGPVPLQALWLPDVRLRVVDARTREDLNEILIERISHSDEGRISLSHTRPVQTNRILQDGTSPLAFSPPRCPTERRIRLRVRTPRHAWRRITVHIDDPSERYVALQPGGDLRVHVDGELDLLATIRVSSPRLPTWPVDSFLWRPGRTAEFDGLPAGSYLVTLALDDHSSAHVFGQTRVTIQPGETNVATVPVTTLRPPAPAFAPVAGTLHVPSEWQDRDQLTIKLRAVGEAADQLRGARGDRFRRLDFDELPPPEHDTWRWSFGSLPPGHYQLQLKRLGFRAQITVPPGGDQAIRVEVPHPCHVTVRTVEAATGTPVDASPTWHSVVEPWSGGVRHHGVERVRQGTFQFHAPRGRIRIAPDHPEFGWVASEFTIDGTEQEIVLPVARCCPARVVLRDGTTELPWARHWRVHLTRNGETIPLRHGPDGAIATTEPCTGHLTVTGISGYHSPEPTQVTLRRGVEQTIEVRLRRQ